MHKTRFCKNRILIKNILQNTCFTLKFKAFKLLTKHYFYE